MKVLILEDFYFRVNEFKKRLAPLGISDITHVNSARDCIQALSNNTYDVVFLDYHLDNIEFEVLEQSNTGAKAAEWLANNPDNPNTKAKVIIHSGSEIGAGEIKRYLPDALHLKAAWKEKEFSKVVEYMKQ